MRNHKSVSRLQPYSLPVGPSSQEPPGKTRARHGNPHDGRMASTSAPLSLPPAAEEPEVPLQPPTPAPATTAPPWLAASLLFAMAGSPKWSLGNEQQLTVHASTAGAATVACEVEKHADHGGGGGGATAAAAAEKLRLHRAKKVRDRIWKRAADEAVASAVATATETGSSAEEAAAQVRELIASERATWPDPSLYKDHVLMQRFADTSECEPVADELRALIFQGVFSRGPNPRHDRHPTTDVTLDELPAPLACKLRGFLSERVAPFICYRYGLPSGSIVEHDVFVVLYDADAPDGQRHLAPHVDESHFSFTMLLNDRDEFDGGGTHFFAGSGSFSRNGGVAGEDGISSEGGTMDPTQGHGVVHRGNLRHSGLPISRGKRILLVGFLQDRRFDKLTMKHWISPESRRQAGSSSSSSSSSAGLVDEDDY